MKLKKYLEKERETGEEVNIKDMYLWEKKIISIYVKLTNSFIHLTSKKTQKIAKQYEDQ